MDRYIYSMSHNMIHLCIDKYNGFLLSGRAYNNTINDVIVFQDIQELFLTIDKIFDQNGNPIAAQEKRSFKKEDIIEQTYQNKPETCNDYRDFLTLQGLLGTIDIVVKTRLTSNWQGIVIYKDEEHPFQGMLGLIEKVISLLEL